MYSIGEHAMRGEALNMNKNFVIIKNPTFEARVHDNHVFVNFTFPDTLPVK